VFNIKLNIKILLKGLSKVIGLVVLALASHVIFWMTARYQSIKLRLRFRVTSRLLN